jgi:hypothetical protein
VCAHEQTQITGGRSEKNLAEYFNFKVCSPNVAQFDAFYVLSYLIMYEVHIHISQTNWFELHWAAFNCLKVQVYRRDNLPVTAQVSGRLHQLQGAREVEALSKPYAPTAADYPS